jgi:hypothetical protein
MEEKVVSKEEMLDYLCGKEECRCRSCGCKTNKSTYDEIYMTLYYLQGITNDLTKLVGELERKENGK